MQKPNKSSIETLKEIGQCLLFVLLCVGALHFIFNEDRVYHTHLGVSLAIWAYGLGMHIASTPHGRATHLVTQKSLSHENI